MVRTLIPIRDRNWGALEDLYREMDHLVQNLFPGEQAQRNGGGQFQLPLDLFETEEQFEVWMDLPGVSADQLQVELHEGELMIAGERPAPTQEEGRTLHRSERRYGQFRRLLTLPTQIEPEKISAEYHDGVLKVTLPKSEKVRPTRIQVKSAKK